MALVFDLDHDHALPHDDLRMLVGGKAANLAVMASELGLPVPPGFVISTEACRAYLSGGWPAGLDAELRTHIQRMEERSGRQFGRPVSPLLVSVRSGAPVSMPGMMDTILNLGLNTETSAGLAAAAGGDAFARDCSDRFGSIFQAVVGREPPADVWDQLRAGIEAVFRSWNSDRAKAYRAVEQIPDDLGTAVTVQAMVFGNSPPDSATGVLFTRNPATGEQAPFGDLLFGAQGEDVVSGTRRTLPMATLEERMPDVARQLWHHADVLERRYADMCDIEFTIENGVLWLLQVRVGKRSPQAALRMAVEMADDPAFPLSRGEAIRRVASHLIDPPGQRARVPGELKPLTTGLAASPGLATGAVVTSPAAAQAAAEAGRPYILVRAVTSPEDVPMMAGAAGVLTSLGGLASHAAVVARGWRVPAVVSAADIEVSDGVISIGTTGYPDGAIISIDGSTGQVYDGAVAGEPVPSPEAATLLAWARDAGVELPGAGDLPRAAARGEPNQSQPMTAADVIRCLSIKRTASIEILAEALLATVATVEPVVAELASAGTLVMTPSLIRLAADGEAQAAALTEAARRRWGPYAAAEALDAFRPFDERVKTVVTAWQLRTVGGQQALNDHMDADYDAAVLADLQLIHAEVSEWLSSLADEPDRLGGYAARLDRAVSAAAGGDHRFVSSPRVDSYHSAWFELHEELIRLAGRTRSDEVTSGRA
jgi:pyruvate, orthophosphate dikinase